MLILDYKKTYSNTDLESAVRAARETVHRVDLPRRVAALATSADRAAALEAWQRVAEIAAWIELHAEDDEAREAAHTAGQLAKRERERLAALPMADDTTITDAARREIIAATDGHAWRSLPPTVRSAIRSGVARCLRHVRPSRCRCFSADAVPRSVLTEARKRQRL